MYPNLKFSNLPITTKLLFLNLMIWAAFFMIIGVIVTSFAIVRNELKTITNSNMESVVTNSQTTRKIADVFADVDLLTHTFYGNKDYLASEGSRLINTVYSISEGTPDLNLKKSLLGLSDTLDSFFSKCAIVNTTLNAIETIDRETHDELTNLENLITKLLLKLTMEGEDISFLEQLLTLVVGYRESLLEISKLYAELGHEHNFPLVEGKAFPLILVIDDLILRLRALTASIPEVASYGGKITAKVKKYRGAVLTFYDEMEGLGLKLADLRNSRSFSMSVMDSIDNKTSSATKLVINGIEKIMLSSGIVTVVLSFLVIITIGFSGAYLIRSNIKNPMMEILRGLESFGKGDFEARIELNRKDEWSTIETAFNNMAADLLKSYTKLQKAHDELETRIERRTSELAKTTEDLKRELIVRKRMEKTLKESEERLSVTLRSIGDGVIATGIEGKVVLMNPVAEQLTGWTQKEAIGKDSKGIFNIVNEEKGAGVESPVERVLREEVVAGHANHTLLIARDGNRIPVDNSGAPIKDDMDNILGVVLIFRDVTEKRRAEEELRKYGDHLESMVELRTKELKAAQNELIRKERLVALGQLTATVAHEIRNPLGTVQTSVFSIGDAIERKEMERVDRALNLAARNIRRCDRIITELLDFTRQKKLNMVPMDIDVWLEDLLDKQKLPKEIEYKLETKSGILIPFDPEYLRRAVINVVTNAVQALEEESPDNKLKVKTAVVGDRFEIKVIDTGPGIPDDIREKIFDPLFSTKSFGVGLGLAIVEDIMAEHDGGIEVESKPGKGTAVVLWLPVEINT